MVPRLSTFLPSWSFIKQSVIVHWISNLTVPVCVGVYFSPVRLLWPFMEVFITLWIWLIRQCGALSRFYNGYRNFQEISTEWSINGNICKLNKLFIYVDRFMIHQFDSLSETVLKSNICSVLCRLWWVLGYWFSGY